MKLGGGFPLKNFTCICVFAIESTINHIDFCIVDAICSITSQIYMHLCVYMFILSVCNVVALPLQ